MISTLISTIISTLISTLIEAVNVIQVRAAPAATTRRKADLKATSEAVDDAVPWPNLRKKDGVGM